MGARAVARPDVSGGPGSQVCCPRRAADLARATSWFALEEGGAVPLLTILTPCFNEEENVREVYQQVRR